MLQEQCELGQLELLRTNYAQAERILASAEAEAWRLRDFDTLARLYMPLQESRRLRRQRCGEGVIKMDYVARGPADRLDPEKIVAESRSGQLLIAGWESVEPALRVRQLAMRRDLYLETFLATTDGKSVVIVPGIAAVSGSAAVPGNAAVPGRNSIVLQLPDLPANQPRGEDHTFSTIMTLWERLHLPYLADADAEHDPIRKIEKYRRAIEVDYACEPAHQRIAALARQLAR